MSSGPLTLTSNDETRLRELANGIARDIEDEDVLLERLGFSHHEYRELTETRVFKDMLSQAVSEWTGASNTHKRIELKAAVSIEHAIPSFHQAMLNDKEPLSSRVKAFEAVARIGKLGNPELAVAGSGQYFKLEINLGAGKAPMILESTAQEWAGEVERPRISRLLEGRPWEEL